MTFPRGDLVSLVFHGCAAAIVELLIINQRSLAAYLQPNTPHPHPQPLTPTPLSSTRHRDKVP